MKKTLLFLAAAFTFSGFVHAQCTPDSQFTAIGFYPDSITGLTVACEGSPYSQVITFVAPVDTTVNIPPIGPITIPLDSVVITGISGLPSGLSYSCQFASCSFLPSVSASSCVEISGTPANGTIGAHPIAITYDAYVTILGSPSSFPFAVGYNLQVDGCAGLNTLPGVEKELVKITDLMGRETVPTAGTPLLYHYSDGTVQRVVRLDQ